MVRNSDMLRIILCTFVPHTLTELYNLARGLCKDHAVPDYDVGQLLCIVAPFYVIDYLPEDQGTHRRV